MAFLSKAEVEQTLLAQLEALGYGIAREEEIGPNGRRPERESYADVALQDALALAGQRRSDDITPEEGIHE